MESPVTQISIVQHKGEQLSGAVRLTLPPGAFHCAELVGSDLGAGTRVTQHRTSGMKDNGHYRPANTLIILIK